MDNTSGNMKVSYHGTLFSEIDSEMYDFQSSRLRRPSTGVRLWNRVLDTFENYDPKDISYLDEKRIYWSRCNVNDSKQLEHVMKNIWNSPRFNIIIDNTSNYETLRRYGIGKYYKEANNEIFCHSCQR